MKYTKPKVFLIGETKINPKGLNALLKELGATGWKTDAPSDPEYIAEFMGRLCYMSFGTNLNPNVTKIREGNQKYLSNILMQLHGSVLEHSNVNFVFTDVSRVFTHELVRHRVGTAISQESLRYVRIDKLKAWVPTVISENEKAMEIFFEAINTMEKNIAEMTKVLGFDLPGVDFHFKKTATSAMRRIAPIGFATKIGWSANLRTLRHVLEMRTHPSAEEEIRYVFSQVGKILLERYPNAFGDYVVEHVDGYDHYIPGSRKV